MTKIVIKTKAFLLDGFLRPLRPLDMVRFGTLYGGWWLPQIRPKDGPALCVGAGHDVSFDVELHRLGFNVYTIDPTPSAIEYVQTFAPELRLVPIGVSSKTGRVAFHSGVGGSEEMWSTRRSKGSTSAGTFPVKTVKDLLESVGEQTVSILKIDIEGAEHEVLQSVLADRVLPACICVEFDDRRIRKVVHSVRSLRRASYELFQIEGWNYTFVRTRSHA